ncbi:flagellar hook-associated protein 2 [Thermicanus aegyptius]|uniref:flagellar hook-associated protein 2 n=1 Tax=Thermicanus aegyptius TaxID=94009 RepID=UPI0004116E50|nr:flagellar hook-associated protein 2 [Thermicanus aegyptius]
MATSISGSGSSSTLYWNRISGLASGMDTESIVKKLMDAERIPLDKMMQKKQLLEWQRDAYREMNSLLLDLRNAAFDMKLQGTYLTKKVTSSDPSVVTATAGTNAQLGIHKIYVDSVAKGVSLVSSQKLPSSSSSSGDTLNLATQFGLTNTPTVTFTLNNKETFTFDTAKETIYDVVKRINEANLGVTASFDSTYGLFFLNTTSTGKSANIEITDGAENFVRDMLKITPGNYHGDDASIRYVVDNQVNGVTITNSSNAFSINGLNLTLNGTTSSPVQLTVSNDTDAVFDKIVQFIGKYNDTIDKINAKLSEPKYRDYLPLTDAQREAMTDQQVEKWEAKARSGILQRDDLLQGTLYQLRAGFSNSVAGLDPSMDSMFDLGFTTGSYETNGKIIIDETKLRSALEQNPEKVMALFTQVDTDPNDNVDERGLAVRLYDSLNSAIKKLTDKAGSPAMTTDTESVIGKALDQLADDMSNFEDHLKQVEDRYWRQFTAMEQAIQRANMQSGWLMQQFGGGQ